MKYKITLFLCLAIGAFLIGIGIVKADNSVKCYYSTYMIEFPDDSESPKAILKEIGDKSYEKVETLTIVYSGAKRNYFNTALKPYTKFGATNWKSCPKYIKVEKKTRGTYENHYNISVSETKKDGYLAFTNSGGTINTKCEYPYYKIVIEDIETGDQGGIRTRYNGSIVEWQGKFDCQLKKDCLGVTPVNIRAKIKDNKCSEMYVVYSEKYDKAYIAFEKDRLQTYTDDYDKKNEKSCDTAYTKSNCEKLGYQWDTSKSCCLTKAVGAEGCAVFGEKTLEKINLAFSIIRLVGVILVLILAIADFVGAVTSSEDNPIKKAFGRLKVRIICLVLLLILPAVIEFLLELIDKSDTFCGIG